MFFPVARPALRERQGVYSALGAAFPQQFSRSMNSVMKLFLCGNCALSRYHWPGNIRELQNVIALRYYLDGPVLSVDSRS